MNILGYTFGFFFGLPLLLTAAIYPAQSNIDRVVPAVLGTACLVFAERCWDREFGED